MQVFKSPSTYPTKNIMLFLGGSIEMGVADDWQTEITNAMRDLDLTVLNPRRDTWDSSWEQRMSNPIFKEQVEWELNALNRADLIAMYFDPNTKSPISLLELGLFKDKPMVVCCPDGFYRKGNVEIVCNLYNITLTHTKAEFINTLHSLSDDFIKDAIVKWNEWESFLKSKTVIPGF